MGSTPIDGTFMITKVVYYCLTCKKRVSGDDIVTMEEENKSAYKHLFYYMHSGATDYVLHPVRVMMERIIEEKDANHT